jgi:hypothetical protein
MLIPADVPSAMHKSAVRSIYGKPVEVRRRQRELIERRKPGGLFQPALDGSAAQRGHRLDRNLSTATAQD